MKHYSIYIELEQRDPVPDLVTSVRDYLARFGHSPAVGTSPRGWLDVQASAPGDSALQAAAAVVAHAQDASGVEAIGIHVLTEAEFDARNGFAPATVPDMFSVTDAAQILGVSRQRILQMIEDHTLASAKKVGSTWVIAQDDVLNRVSAPYYARQDPDTH